jgi:MFS family permease
MSYFNKIFLLLGLGFGVVGLERMVAAFVLPAIQKEFALNYMGAGAIVAIFGVTWAIGVYVLGSISDYIGRKPVIVLFLIFGGLCSWLSGIAWSFLFLIIIRGIMGFAEGGLWGPITATIAEESRPENRARNVGFIPGMFLVIGTAIGPILSIQLMLHYGWRNVFYIYAIPAVVLGILIWIVMKESPTIQAMLNDRRRGVRSKRVDAQGKEIKYGDMFKYRNILIFLIVWPIDLAFLYLFTTFGVFYMEKIHQLPMPVIGLIMSGFGLGGFLGCLVVGSLSDRLGRKKSLIGSFFLCAIVAYAFASLGLGASPVAFFALVFFSGFFFAGAGPIVTSSVVETVGFALAASAIGVVTGVGDLVGGGILPLVGGGLADLMGVKTPLYLASFLMIVSTVCCFLLQETAPKFAKAGLKVEAIS